MPSPQPLYLFLLAAVHLRVHHTCCLLSPLPALFNKWHYALPCPGFCLFTLLPTPSAATLLLFLSFPHLHLPLSDHLFRSSLPGCRVPLHINRTLVTAFSASSCLLSPSRCSISTIICLHTPTFLTVASSSHPVLSICLCLPFLHISIYTSLSFLSSAHLS